MKKLLLLVLPLLLLCTGCPKVEQNARDTAAALNGAITSAQAQYQQSCATNPGQSPCLIINKAVDAQNALITAAEAYCGWSVTNPPPDPSATCVPVKTAQAGLQTAINNANLFITELKGVIK